MREEATLLFAEEEDEEEGADVAGELLLAGVCSLRNPLVSSCISSLLFELLSSSSSALVSVAAMREYFFIVTGTRRDEFRRSHAKSPSLAFFLPHISQKATTFRIYPTHFASSKNFLGFRVNLVYSYTPQSVPFAPVV